MRLELNPLISGDEVVNHDDVATESNVLPWGKVPIGAKKYVLFPEIT